jgi:hypothetical protein
MEGGTYLPSVKVSAEESGAMVIATAETRQSSVSLFIVYGPNRVFQGPESSTMPIALS